MMGKKIVRTITARTRSRTFRSLVRSSPVGSYLLSPCKPAKHDHHQHYTEPTTITTVHAWRKATAEARVR